MKNIKKSIILFGVVVLSILLVSTVTAVAQTNSEPVMNTLEGQEIVESLNEMAMAEAEEAVAIPANLEEIVENLNMEGFVDFFQSDEFIELMTSDIMVDFILSDEVTDLYNLESVQEYIESDAFTDAYNTDEAQYFLDVVLESSPLSEDMALVVYLIGLAIGILLWIPAGTVIIGLAGVILVLDILSMLQNLGEAFNSYMDSIGEFINTTFGSLIELLPFIETILLLMSGIAGLFLSAIVMFFTIIAELVLFGQTAVLAIVFPAIFGAILLMVYVYIIEELLFPTGVPTGASQLSLPPSTSSIPGSSQQSILGIQGISSSPQTSSH